MKKYEQFDIGGSIVKEDERYVVTDNPTLNNLIVSKTILNPQQATSGHKHKGQEEIYIFVKGSGIMHVDSEIFPVKKGDIILIEDGEFHKVLNNQEEKTLDFVCVFDGARSH